MKILGQENSARLDSEYAPKGTIDNLYAGIGVIFFYLKKLRFCSYRAKHQSYLFDVIGNYSRTSKIILQTISPYKGMGLSVHSC